MNIFVATDGTLDTEAATAMVERLYADGDKVIVFTAIPFPRAFLRTYAEISGAQEIAEIADAAGASPIGIASGARAAEQMAAHAHDRPIDPMQVSGPGSYFETVAKRCCDPIIDALAAKGITAERVFAPTENQTARTILAEAEVRKADVMVIGSHGQGKFEGRLGSTVTKLVRRAPIDVVVVR